MGEGQEGCRVSGSVLFGAPRAIFSALAPAVKGAACRGRSCAFGAVPRIWTNPGEVDAPPVSASVRGLKPPTLGGGRPLGPAPGAPGRGKPAKFASMIPFSAAERAGPVLEGPAGELTSQVDVE